jgi:trimethylamine:corrinoid methyltransferase-like protein
MRDLFLPRFMDRRPYNEWIEKGDGPRDWARNQALNILETHQPETLDPQVSTELSRIIASYENKVP